MIRIGLYKDEPESENLSYSPFLAFDGGVGLEDGEIVSLASGETTRTSTGIQTEKESLKADNDGAIIPVLLPKRISLGTPTQIGLG